MTTTPDNTSSEPADLSELTATDALLDRLGGRTASEDDLLDPTAAFLAELVAVIDQSREQDVEAARLVEVLAGRPLYIAGAEADTTAQPLTIDLTAADISDVKQVVEGKNKDGKSSDAEPGESLIPGSRLPSPAVIKIPTAAMPGPRRWERALNHVPLPAAAAVLLLLAVGGGVSAAVTGNPMAPVDGITRVMAQLPGVESSLDKVKTEISAAQAAALNSDTRNAELHLKNARAGLNDVPDSEQTHLNNLINQVATLVPTETPSVGATPADPGTGLPGSVPPNAEATTPAGENPPATAGPTASDPAPDPTTEPSSDPVPTEAPSTSDPAPSTEVQAADPTPSSEATSG